MLNSLYILELVAMHCVLKIKVPSFLLSYLSLIYRKEVFLHDLKSLYKAEISLHFLLKYLNNLILFDQF